MSLVSTNGLTTSYSELNAALSALEHENFALDHGADSLLVVLIERCYSTFCSIRFLA